MADTHTPTLSFSSGIPQRPLPDAEALKDFYVGKDISEVPMPAAILDVAKIRRHCSSMLETVEALGVGFRPHVKTHKTQEVTSLQIGKKSLEINIVFSTLAELEHLLPLLKDEMSRFLPTSTGIGGRNRGVNALYGIPLPPSQVSRLATLGRQLGWGSISVMVDHASQLDAVVQLSKEMEFPAKVFLKIDTGYHRAGLPWHGINKGDLVERLLDLEKDENLVFLGLYSHSSLSYNDSTPKAALESLQAEIDGCEIALNEVVELGGNAGRPMIISVGATPQVAAAHHLISSSAERSEALENLEATIGLNKLGKSNYSLEFHAGVYSVLDMQQVTTNAKTKAEDFQKEIGITVAVEVISLYNDKERDQPEALLAVGALGLGREPCAHYKGWGVVKLPVTLEGKKIGRRLIVTRISQEHSIVSWEYDQEKEKGSDLPPIPLDVGQVVEIFPNHACITGAMYGWYLVVDSDKDEQGSKITDVWIRTGGW